MLNFTMNSGIWWQRSVTVTFRKRYIQPAKKGRARRFGRAYKLKIMKIRYGAVSVFLFPLWSSSAIR